MHTARSNSLQPSRLVAPEWKPTTFTPRHRFCVSQCPSLSATTLTRSSTFFRNRVFSCTIAMYGTTTIAFFRSATTLAMASTSATSDFPADVGAVYTTFLSPESSPGRDRHSDCHGYISAIPQAPKPITTSLFSPHFGCERLSGLVVSL